MDQLIESIRVACASDATDETKQRGAQACRAILTALEAKGGEPLVPAADSPGAPSTAAEAAPTPANAMPAIAQIVGSLRGMPPEQLLDLAIERLRAALPKDTAVPPVQPVRFQLIPIAPIAATVETKKGNV